MPQSNVIAGFFLVAFFIFITARGELPKYFALFFGEASKPLPAEEKPSKTDDDLPAVSKIFPNNPMEFFTDPGSTVFSLPRAKRGLDNVTEFLSKPPTSPRGITVPEINDAIKKKRLSLTPLGSMESFTTVLGSDFGS